MRYERLRKIEMDLKTGAYSQKELMDKYNIPRSTISRDIRDLSCIIPIIRIGNKYQIIEGEK